MPLPRPSRTEHDPTGRQRTSCLRPRALALALAATSAVLGSCGPSSATTTSSSSAARGAPSSTAAADLGESASPVASAVAVPEPPADLARTDADGAIAASVHLLALLDHAYATGDTAPLLALSGPGCGWCRSMADQVGEVDGAGSSAGTTLLVHAPSQATATDLGDGSYVVELTADESYVTPREVDGVAVLDLLSTQTYVFACVVARTATGWQVDGVEIR